MFAIDAATGADVVAHLFKPSELVRSEGNPTVILFLEPRRETLLHVLLKRLEWCCGFDGSANERNEVSEAARLGGTSHRDAATAGKSIPQFWNGLRTEVGF